MNITQFRKELIKYPGAQLDEELLQYRSICVDAPKGFIWAASHSHCLCAGGCPIDLPSKLYLEERNKDLEETSDRMLMGLEECMVEDCKYCQG